MNLKKHFIRADWRKANQWNEPLESGEPVDCYGADRNSAVDELVDRGGGYLHDNTGDVVAVVAPLPRWPHGSH